MLSQKNEVVYYNKFFQDESLVNGAREICWQPHGNGGIFIEPTSTLAPPKTKLKFNTSINDQSKYLQINILDFHF